MKKLIDIHSHILHNLDDGSSDLNSSVEMCKIAIENGTSDIIATPHAFHPQFNVNIEDRNNRIFELQNELDRLNLPINVHPGFEYRIHEKLIRHLIESSEFTLCGKGKFFLLEFDPMFIPPNFETFLFDAKVNGFQPILVHPERNYDIIKNIDLLENLVNKGLEIQITASSIIGKKGRTVRHFSEKIVKKNIVHYVASDIHCPNSKDYNLENAYKRILNLCGEDYTDSLFIRNPKKIVMGE